MIYVKEEYPDFNAVKDKKRIIKFIKGWFKSINASAVIGISGGKDSTVAAALCVEALGKDRVVGVLMPNGEQKDLNDALTVVKHLGIRYRIINIQKPYENMLELLSKESENDDFCIDLTSALKQNLAPRLRMTTLYAVAQGLPEGGRIINTCNRSEDYIGYSTKYGDSAGDFAPLAAYTASEVIAIGDLTDMPKELIHKTPSDGLCGLSDEENFGFTYEVLDHYIKTGKCENEEIKKKIDKLHKINLHKITPMLTVIR